MPKEMAVVITHGKGSKAYDDKGREYIDYLMGSGAVLLGHAHPKLTKAVRNQLDKGSTFFCINPAAILLAQELVKAIPCAEKLRFTGSGSEAILYAIRLAKAYSGREKILKFEGAYHGSSDYGVMSLSPKQLLDFPLAEPTSAGICRGIREEVLIAPFNDLETTTRIIEHHARSLAAVIVEPIQRCTPPDRGFLEGLRAVTRERDILLIFDEVVTGFRLAYGGAQEYYGVIPDLATYGKGMSGGYAIGAVCGRAEILDLCDEAKKDDERFVWHVGTLNGNPIAAAACLATLAELREPGTYERFHALGRELRAGFRNLLLEMNIPGQVLGEGPLCQVLFAKEKVMDYRTAAKADTAKTFEFMMGMFMSGIFLRPDGTKLYLSLAHTDEDIKRTHDIARTVLHQMHEK
ncbi:MAG: aspartate aminotransferase family protein [Acidiferrobacterales bacterium]